ncbi:hypothetical protein niasHT_037581 [Heterodera trifolii]|uniref:Ubiquitin-like domain-containing protein n=1 Tax=Heterodera trifolii TaxID=157864 RepID=A0ABD2I6D1_9BILA
MRFSHRVIASKTIFVQVFVRVLGGRTITILARSLDTIENVKAKIQDKKGIPPDQQQLRFRKATVECSNPLGLQHPEGSTLHLSLTLIGETRTRRQQSQEEEEVEADKEKSTDSAEKRKDAKGDWAEKRKKNKGDWAEKRKEDKGDWAEKRKKNKGD